MSEILEKKVSRLERKVKAFEETFKQQNLIAQKYNEALIALQEKEEFLTTVIESNKNAIIAINQHHIVTVYNQAAEEMFGFTKEEMLHKDSLLNIIPPSLQEEHIRAVEHYLKNHHRLETKTKYYTFDAQRKDKTVFPIRIGFGVSESNGNIMIVANIEDLSSSEAIKREKEILQYKANHDSLTNLPNRLMFQEKLEQIILESRKNHSSFTLLYIDLDKFKDVNDGLGHDYGDEVLKIAARRMKNIIREDDFLARLGGDEFVIILCNVSKRETVEKLVLKLLNAIEEKMQINGHSLSISASIGIAVFPDNAEDEFEIVKTADHAMYDAKRGNGDKYLFYAS